MQHVLINQNTLILACILYLQDFQIKSNFRKYYFDLKFYYILILIAFY